MVDEVQITNIGGKNGVASEVTLKQLQQTMDKIARSKGLNPQEANAGLTNLSKKLESSGKTIGNETGARRDNIDALDDHTGAIRKAGGFLLNFGSAIVGSGIRSVKGLSEELISGSNNLSDFTQHIPLAGGVISMFTGVIDNSVNTFQSMAKTGAAFDYSMGQLRSTAARAGLSLEEFAGLVNENAEQFAAFGGTVTQGARRTTQLVSALGGQRESLLAMGLTFEDINEQMTTYQMLTRAGARAETRNRTEQAEAAASLTKNMLTLSKLTGEDIKAQQEKIAQAQMDVAFQRELAKMDEEERQKLNQAMAEAQATGGEVAVNALKAEVLGMPPLTQELQTFVATQGESFRVLQDSVARVRDTSISAEEFEERRAQRMGDYLETQLAAQNRYDTALAAGAAGAEGIVATLSEQMGMSANVLMKYVTDTGNGLEFAREAFEEDLASGEIQAGREGELGAMAQFRDALRNARSSLMDNLVNPLLKLVTPAIGEATASLDDFTESEAFTQFSETIRNKLEEFKAWFGDWIGKFKEDPQKAWNELMENHIKPFFDKAIQGAKEAIGSAFKDMITSPSVVGALVAGFGALFAARAVTSALTKGIAGMFAKAQAARAASTAAGSAGAAASSQKGRALGKVAGRAAVPLAIGLGALDIGRTLTDEDLSREEKGTRVSGTTGGVAGGLAGAKAGAAVGAFGGPLGILAGSLVGGGLGYLAGSDIGKGLGSMVFGNENQEQITNENNQENSQDDVAVASQASMVTDEQLQRLEKLVGFAPQVRTLTGSIGTFQEEFNSLDLDYREIDRTVRSLEKMTEQLENINEQLQGGNDDGFFGFGGNNDDNETTAGDVLSDFGSGQKEQLEKLNRVMTDILGVLLESNNMNKRQLTATRSMTGNLYQGF